MSWHFSRALVEEYSAANCLDGAQFAPSNGSHTPQAYLCSDRMTAFSTRSLYGMTFAPLTDDLGEALLTWFRGAFPAKTSVLPEKAQASRGNDQGYGKKWTESLARFCRESFSWKTHQCSLLGGGYESLQTLPPWGMWDATELWGHQPRVQYVKARESGLSLLRPTAQCWKAWTFLRISSLVRKNHADGNIQEQSARCLNKMITAESNEILMQWPPKWTDLKPLETDKIHTWQQWHSGF